jgi:hypothetical protein
MATSAKLWLAAFGLLQAKHALTNQLRNNTHGERFQQ